MFSGELFDRAKELGWLHRDTIYPWSAGRSEGVSITGLGEREKGSVVLIEMIVAGSYRYQW